jgi:hypothetical protein
MNRHEHILAAQSLSRDIDYFNQVIDYLECSTIGMETIDLENFANIKIDRTHLKQALILQLADHEAYLKQELLNATNYTP